MSAKTVARIIMFLAVLGMGCALMYDVYMNTHYPY